MKYKNLQKKDGETDNAPQEEAAPGAKRSDNEWLHFFQHQLQPFSISKPNHQQNNKSSPSTHEDNTSCSDADDIV